MYLFFIYQKKKKMSSMDIVEPNAYRNYVYNFITTNKNTFHKDYYMHNVPKMFFPKINNRTLSLTTILKTWRTSVQPSYALSTREFKDFILASIMEQYWDGRILEN